MRLCAWLLVLVGGCVASIDGGVLTQPTLHPNGGSATVRLGMGGGGSSTSQLVASLGIDTRLDIASDGSRWTGGASLMGGVKVVPKFFLDGRIGVWHAIVSGASSENAAVPSFELGGYIPFDERFDPKYPQHGESNTGVVFGVREDLDAVNYFTVFVGYAAFISPGY